MTPGMGLGSHLFPRNPRGRLASRALLALGMVKTCRRSSRLSYFTPAKVQVELPNCPAFAMSSSRGQDHIVRELWIDGAAKYEPPLPVVYAALAPHATNVLDVGANSGLYALMAASCSKQAKVYAFEPFPPAIASLRHNIAMNKWQDRIEIIEGAAGEATGSFKLYIPAKTHGDTLETSCSLERTFRDKHEAVIDVQVVSLDEFVAKRGLQNVSLLRADVEGAEYRVIGGAQEILRKHRPYVFVEVLSEAAAQTLSEFPDRVGYICCTMGTREVVQQRRVIFDRARTNHLWCPRERLEELRKLLDTAHIALT